MHIMGVIVSAIEITWHNCAEQMPPDDRNQKVILDHPDKLMYMTSDDAHRLIPIYKQKQSASRWTEFTKEKWEELNK